MTTLRGRTPEDDEQAGATDSRETPRTPALCSVCGRSARRYTRTIRDGVVFFEAWTCDSCVTRRPPAQIGDRIDITELAAAPAARLNPQGYPPILGECLCGHQFRKHRKEGDRHPCLEFIGGVDDDGDERLCDCALFEDE